MWSVRVLESKRDPGLIQICLFLCHPHTRKYQVLDVVATNVLFRVRTQAQSMDWMTLLSVLVGAFSAIGAGVFAHWYQEHRKAKSLRSALRAEIKSIIELVARRDHVTHFKSFLDAWKQGQRLDQIPGIVNLTEQSRDRATNIFLSNLSDIGLLPPDIATDVVTFYQLYEGITDDIIGLEGLDLETRKNLLADDLRLWEDAHALGQSLLERL